jgi:hypothetical protein
MDFVNKTKLKAGWTMGFDRDGRELVIIAVKATFTFPQPGQEPKLAEEQAPLVEADVFTGEPAFSAPLYESDYAHRKPKCDVLLNGSAYAPSGKPAERITVSVQVGSMNKSFDVVGNRVWQAGALYIAVSKIEPFTVMPISYNNAWGGVDKSQEDPSKHHYYPMNHAGVGYHEYTSGKYMDGKPLPNTEERGSKINNPKGKYRPMAFGPVGRAWQPRPKFAGTYDQKWLDEQAPFWPDDFDYRYFQAAPEDQQIPFPSGGEEVVLTNLTPEGITRFRLPKIKMPVVVIPASSNEHPLSTIIDTVVIEPDKKRFMLAWRATMPMRRCVFDIGQTIVGERLRSVRHARIVGMKNRYANLAELIRAERSSSRRR